MGSIRLGVSGAWLEGGDTTQNIFSLRLSYDSLCSHIGAKGFSMEFSHDMAVVGKGWFFYTGGLDALQFMSFSKRGRRGDLALWRGSRRDLVGRDGLVEYRLPSTDGCFSQSLCRFPFPYCVTSRSCIFIVATIGSAVAL